MQLKDKRVGNKLGGNKQILHCCQYVCVFSFKKLDRSIVDDFFSEENQQILSLVCNITEMYQRIEYIQTQKKKQQESTQFMF